MSDTSQAKEKVRVLLVDDEEIVRIYFRDIFWIYDLQSHFEILVASDISEAEKIIMNKATRPKVIFLDLVLPYEKDGRVSKTPEGSFMLLQKIKSDPELKNIKVVILSGHDEKVYRDKAKELGAETYLIKGDNTPRDLIEFVKKSIAQN